MSEAAETPGDRAARRYKRLALVLSVALVIALLVAVGRAIDSSGPEGPNFPAGGPAEFLYLDSERAAAYLAQVNGGTFDSETLTSKLSRSLDAKLAVQGVGETGSSAAGESSSERVVKPTAASIYFALLAALEREDEEDGGIVPIQLQSFEDYSPELVKQGRFVRFTTNDLLSPLYLNAYLAVMHANTLKALFPGAPTRQVAAEGFADEIGEEPRAVFALEPGKTSTANAAPGEKGGASGSNPDEEPAKYLLPMRIGQLTNERSLLKYGGGKFVVVGKIVRMFPEGDHEREPAYVDSPTMEIWRNPLKLAPGELLCRTDPKCISEVRAGKLLGEQREGEIEASRNRALKTLTRQTRIKTRGAVIIPIAIYK